MITLRRSAMIVVAKGFRPNHTSTSTSNPP
jgi:hypothetical protein